MRSATPSQPAFIDDYLAYLLAQASHLISHEFHEVARRAGVSVLQWRVLATLVDGTPRSVGEVAVITLTPQSTLTRVADRMGEQGLLVRVGGSTDRRITQLQITPEGKKLAQRLVKQARQHEAAVLAPLGEVEAAVLKHALHQLISLHAVKVIDN
jgi:MarR family transcriptional regulator, organic hydroperoxide resistance regulator